jgi:hypothetical protein
MREAVVAARLATRSPLLARPGGVEGEGADAGVAAHYGDPLREQRLLAEGLAVVDLSHRGVVTVSGADRLTWLHSITTQQLTGLGARESREALVLSPKGHIEHGESAEQAALREAHEEAALEPAGPPPTTTTSHSIDSISSSWRQTSGLHRRPTRSSNKRLRVTL